MRKISKAVVTGGAGFIGSYIVDELIKRDVETYVIDNLSTGSLNNLFQHKKNKLLHVFVNNARIMEDLLSGINDIDVVFHEAAIARVPRPASQPMVVHDTNVSMTLEIMNFCVKRGVKGSVYASSAPIYAIVTETQ